MADVWDVAESLNSGGKSADVWDLAEYANDRVSGNPEASPAETERLRRQFVANEGTTATKVRDVVNSAFNPRVKVAPADSLTDWATRVVPQSTTQLIPKLALGTYEAVKGQTDPVISSFTERGLPGNRMMANAAENITGVAKSMAAPTGLMGYEAAKEAWTTDPAGSALAVAPTVKLAKNAITSMRTTTPVKLDAIISKQYQQAVRPSVRGTAGSHNQFAKSNTKAVEGVYDIVRAKDRGELKLGDEMAGQPLVNRLPESMQEHLQAVSQAKGNTFAKYDAMKRAAGESASIEVNSIAAELEKAATDPVLNDLRPATAKYMQAQAEVLKQRGAYTADQAQQAIATLNKDLDAFYRNPSPDMAGKVVVDASIAKHLRKTLDDVITQDQGPGYQQLKNEYGRLAAMEKDAGHRARIAGRAAPASLIDALGGYLSAGEIVSGIFATNPALIAKGGAVLALKHYFNKMRSPDYGIKRMYKTADKLYKRPIQPDTPSGYMPSDFPSVEMPPEVEWSRKGNRTPLNLPVGPTMEYDPILRSMVPKKGLLSD